MLSDLSRGPLAQPSPLRPSRALPVLILATLLAVGPFFGPEALRIGAPFSWPALLLQTTGVAAIAAVWLVPTLGVSMLVLFVYLNVSQVLVSQHHLPSSLRILILLLFIVAWRRFGGRALARSALHPMTLLLSLYTLLLLVTSTVAIDTTLADRRWVEIGKATFILTLFMTMGSSPETIRRATWAMVGAAGALSTLGIVQHLTGTFDNSFWGFARIKQAHIVDELVQPRIAGPLGDPNFFAQVLLIVVPLALTLAWLERTRRLRLLALGSAGVIVTAIVLTYSRGAGLAVACQFLLLWATARNRLRLAVLTAAAALLLVLVLPSEFTRRLTTVQQLMPGEHAVLDPDSSFEARKLYTHSAWLMFLDHPALGVGAGNYTEHFSEYAARAGSAVRFRAIDSVRFPHNLYLEIAAESGLIGLLLFLAILMTAFYLLERSRRDFLGGENPFLAALARAMQISLVGYLISSLFLHGHFIRYLWLLFAFAAALDQIARDRFRPAATIGDGVDAAGLPWAPTRNRADTDDLGTSP